MASPFELIVEIEPPTKPSLVHARHQIGVLGKVADAYLVPDNHLGRATVSSLAVAREVASMGGRAIACLNSRDRNVLGFRRDLLTAAAFVSMIIPLIVFLSLQRFFVRGLLAGSVKG